MKWLRSDGGPVFYGYSNRTPVTGDVQMITTCLVFGTIFTAFLIVFPGVRKQVSVQHVSNSPLGETKMSFPSSFHFSFFFVVFFFLRTKSFVPRAEYWQFHNRRQKKKKNTIIVYPYFVQLRSLSSRNPYFSNRFFFFFYNFIHNNNHGDCRQSLSFPTANVPC